MTACPICDSTRDTSVLCKVNLIYRTDFDLAECPGCKVKYFSPIPDINQLTTFYSRHYYNYDRWRQQAKADYYIKRLLKQGSTGSILDIGCASGYFLDRIASATDWKAHGVELSQQPSLFAREKLGLDVITGDLFSAGYPDDSFDALHIGDVLEHVPNPVEFMQECRRILKTGGKIYLAVPNGYIDSRGLIRYFRQTGVPGRHASGHIFFFEAGTFDLLFKRTGFESVYEYTILIKHGLRARGWWPQRRLWKNFYQPSTEPEQPCETVIPEVTDKPHSDLYYKYHFYKKIWLGIPGLHNLGNDHLIELKAV